MSSSFNDIVGIELIYFEKQLLFHIMNFATRNFTGAVSISL